MVYFQIGIPDELFYSHWSINSLAVTGNIDWNLLKFILIIKLIQFYSKY